MNREEALKNHNPKYSFEDFTNKKLSDVTDINNSVIIGSCFYQETDIQQEDPCVEVFPSNMTGVTFIECNLDNVYIPPGNIVDPSCSCKRIKRQNDGELWILDGALKPIKPLHRERLLEIGENVLPEGLPREPLSGEALQRRCREYMERLKKYLGGRDRSENATDK
jgi:hypothetical protein